MNRPYITTDYKDLSWLAGRELRIKRGWKEFEFKPDKVVFLKDYGLTVLIELTFVRSDGWERVPPRSYKKMISKAALACGDIRLIDTETGIELTGREVTRFNMHAETEQVKELIWE